MKCIFAREPITSRDFARSIFLMGPTLRTRACSHCGGCGEVFHIPGAHEAPCHRCKADPSYRERNWRQDVIDMLKAPPEEDYTLLVPEFRDFREWTDEDKRGIDAQIEWETNAIAAARVVLCWIPRSKQLPGFTTNVELGIEIGTRRLHRMAFGHPPDAEHVSYLVRRARLSGIGLNLKVHYTLRDTVLHALEILDR